MRLFGQEIPELWAAEDARQRVIKWRSHMTLQCGYCSFQCKLLRSEYNLISYSKYSQCSWCWWL